MAQTLYLRENGTNLKEKFIDISSDTMAVPSGTLVPFDITNTLGVRHNGNMFFLPFIDETVADANCPLRCSGLGLYPNSQKDAYRKTNYNYTCNCTNIDKIWTNDISYNIRNSSDDHIWQSFSVSSAAAMTNNNYGKAVKTITSSSSLGRMYLTVFNEYGGQPLPIARMFNKASYIPVKLVLKKSLFATPFSGTVTGTYSSRDINIKITSYPSWLKSVGLGKVIVQAGTSQQSDKAVEYDDIFDVAAGVTINNTTYSRCASIAIPVNYDQLYIPFILAPRTSQVLTDFEYNFSFTSSGNDLILPAMLREYNL